MFEGILTLRKRRQIDIPVKHDEEIHKPVSLSTETGATIEFNPSSKDFDNLNEDAFQPEKTK